MIAGWFAAAAGLVMGFSFAGGLTVEAVQSRGLMAVVQGLETYISEFQEAGEAGEELKRIGEQYALKEDLPFAPAGMDRVVLFRTSDQEYEVQAGDTLEALARRFYGDEAFAEELGRANEEALGAERGLESGMRLLVPEGYYVREQSDGLSTPNYRFDYPMGWVNGSQHLDACLDAFWSGSLDGTVYCHVTENRFGRNGFSEKWEAVTGQIARAGNDTCKGAARDLSFERYLVHGGPDLYTYSFTYEGNEDKSRYMVCYMLGDWYQAEFIGRMSMKGQSPRRSAQAIENVTRYMAATYREVEGGDRVLRFLKYRPYLGADKWPWDSLHNPFALALAQDQPEEEAALEGADEELKFKCGELEAILREAVRQRRGMNGSEWEEFSSRKLRASDLAWITKLTIEESIVDGRDKIEVNRYALNDRTVVSLGLDSLEDLANLKNLKELFLCVGGITDYSPLGKLQKLESVSLSMGTDVKGLECLGTLPNLRKLVLDEADNQYLADHFYQGTNSTFRPSKEGKNQQFYKDSGLSFLSQCVNLEYLELRTASPVQDFGFLKDLPRLYAFLWPFAMNDDNWDSDNREKDQEYRLSLFKKDSFPQIQCLVVGDDWVRNPE